MGVDLKEQGTNVFNLTVEEPKRVSGIIFNPTEELKTVWEKVTSGKTRSLEVLVAAKLFKPEIFDILNRRSPTKVLNSLKEKLRKKKFNGSSFAIVYVDCIQIYPEYFCNVTPEEVYPRFKIDLVSALDDLAPQSDPGLFARALAHHKIIYPGEELPHEPEKYKEYLREEITDLLDEGVVVAAIENIFYWNVLFPKETMRPTDKVLREAKEFLNQFIELGDYSTACQLAIDLYYVTSGRVEVSKSGLVALPEEEKPIFQQPATMPAERSF